MARWVRLQSLAWGFSGNKKQPTTDRFQNNFFSSLRREDQIKGQEQGYKQDCKIWRESNQKSQQQWISD